MNKQRFYQACERAANSVRERSSIGLLSEKSLHRALKLYFEPHEENHEVKIGGFVADIVGEEHIIEIQTANFSKMKRKLSEFLQVSPVTVVYPIIVNKTVICMDENTGEVTSKRRSPVHGSVYSFFDEAWGIKEFLTDDRLAVCLLLIEAEEYRLYGGTPEKRRKRQRSKKGCYKSDRIPTELIDEIYIKDVKDLLRFIPDGLPEEFTVKDVQSAAGIDRYLAWEMTKLLADVGLAEKTGVVNRADVYKIKA